MTTDPDRTAAQIIADARDRYTNADPAPERGGADAFDYMISVEGIAPFGELYQAAYAIANQAHPVQPGSGEEALAACRARADELWQQVLPELERYASECREAKYTGWSRASGGPIRRVR